VDVPANASPDDRHDQLLDASLLPSQPLTAKVLRRPVESAQYLAIRYTERLAEAGAVTSVGSRGDSYDTQSSIVDEERRLVVWPVIRVACVETAGGGLRHDGRGCRLGA
jgi:hypothetical protein